MKKQLLTIIALLVTQISFANVIEGEAFIPVGYYDGVTGKKGAENILSALNTCISKDYNEISYKGLEPHYLNTDFYADTLWDTYSTCHFTYDMANPQQKYVCDGWNKEHVCCQSWLGSGPMVSDMFNVYPTDARINNLRSNYPYGVVSSFSGFSNDPNKHGLGKLGNSALSGCGGTVYEPDDQYKGDFARTFFYMVARYRNNSLNAGNGSTMFSSSPTNLTAYSLSFLLAWHRQDPVSAKEIDRNQGVYGEQNNRNPFIDYPELVEYIWGNKVGQTVDLSSMTPTCDTYVSAAKHGVNWSVNGIIIATDSVRDSRKVLALPSTPTSCSASSESFVGWSSSSISGVSATAPDAIYTKVDEVPAVVGDITYYAVFAHAEVIGNGTVSATETITFSSKGYSSGQEVSSVTQGDVTVTFGKGTAGSNVPKYYNTGEAMRCYPGNTMTVAANEITRIDLTFGSGDSTNPITATPGTFSNSTWTGNANSVVFSVGGSSSHRRIAGLTVTMNVSGAQTVYSNYLTSCEGGQAIDEVEAAAAAKKLLKDGQLYIIVGENMYTITGQKIK